MFGKAKWGEKEETERKQKARFRLGFEKQMNKGALENNRIKWNGTVKYYAQIRLQIWQNSVCTGQGNLPLIIQ